MTDKELLEFKQQLTDCFRNRRLNQSSINKLQHLGFSVFLTRHNYWKLKYKNKLYVLSGTISDGRSIKNLISEIMREEGKEKNVDKQKTEDAGRTPTDERPLQNG